MSWNVAGVTTAKPPIVVDAVPQLGPSRASAITFSGERVTVEWSLTQPRQEIVVQLQRVTASEKTALEGKMATAGLTTLATGTRSWTVLWAERSRQKFTPIWGPYPDVNQAGGTVYSALQHWEAELVFYPA